MYYVEIMISKALEIAINNLVEDKVR